MRQNIERLFAQRLVLVPIQGNVRERRGDDVVNLGLLRCRRTGGIQGFERQML